MIKGLSEEGEFSGWEEERKKFFEDREKEVEVEMEERKSGSSGTENCKKRKDGKGIGSRGITDVMER